MMQQVADDVINDLGNYNDNTHFSINYALTKSRLTAHFHIIHKTIWKNGITITEILLSA